MSNELKPCPFCLSEAIIETNTGNIETASWFWAECRNDKCHHLNMYPCKTQEQAESDWNTRPIEDALQARIAELSKPILCAKCNDHLIANDGAICEVCASMQESAITELQGDIEELKRRVANAMDSAMAAQNCIKIARVDIYNVLERIKYILTAPQKEEK